MTQNEVCREAGTGNAHKGGGREREKSTHSGPVTAVVHGGSSIVLRLETSEGLAARTLTLHTHRSTGPLLLRMPLSGLLASYLHRPGGRKQGGEEQEDYMCMACDGK